MQYLVFGTLLILGAVVMGLFLFFSHAKHKVVAEVAESYCDVKQTEQGIESIKVKHLLLLGEGEEQKKVETDLLPVRELDGAKLNLFFDQEKQEIYLPDYQKYIPFLGAFLLSGLLCFALYVLDLNEFHLFEALSGQEWIALLIAVIAVAAFSYVCVLINTNVVKTKGSFEAVQISEDGNMAAEIYCLWYGEHRQYARRVNGMRLKQNPDKKVTLFFNTKTGTVCRVQELVLSMCISAIAFAAMIVILLL